MFATVDSAELPVASVFFPKGNRLWSYVAIGLHAPWFYIEYQISTGSMRTSSMLLLSSVEQILELSLRSDIALSQVHLMSPGQMNKSGTWQMNGVVEIIQAVQYVDEITVPVTIYRIDDGRELVFGSINRRNKLRNHKSVFVFSRKEHY